MAEVAIVGSGVAGVGAALALAERGIRPRLFDVGRRPAPHAPLRENLYRYRRTHDAGDLMIGDDLAGLRNLIGPPGGEVPEKLAAPRMAFVTAGAETYSPVEAAGFYPIQSFAAGGLANAWGAGLYRFDADELAGTPVTPAELAPFYDRLTAEIGVSGAADDLAPFFGDPAGLLPPLRLSGNCRYLLANYRRRRDGWRRRGLFLGRPRLGVLSEDRGPRAACDYGNREFFQPELPHIYSPALTLRRLADAGRVEYLPGRLVRGFRRRDGRVRVYGEDPATGEAFDEGADYLLLAAGPVGSAKLALASNRDYAAALPLLDNPATQVPLVIPARVFQGLDEGAFGLTQLNLVYRPPGPGPRLQASLLETTGPARAVFFRHLPLAARDRLRWIRDVVPAITVMQLFAPAPPGGSATLRLREDGRLRVAGGSPPVCPAALKAILRGLFELGAWGLPAFARAAKPGHSMHYVGCLPMRRDPRGPYECDPAGRLGGDDRVRVADGATLAHLPAKNSSFTVMANAMRVAARLADELGAGR